MDYGLKHTHFLYNVVAKGERINNEDIIFLLNTEKEIEIAKNEIDFIRERLLND